MTIAYWCVLIAAVIPLICDRHRQGGRRALQQSRSAGLARTSSRAIGRAPQRREANSFEAFPFFAAAVIIAHLTHAPQGRLDLLAVIFVLARIAYVVCYLADWHWVRSCMSGLPAIAACLAIFIIRRVAWLG